MKQGSDHTYQEPGDLVDSQQPGMGAGGTRSIVLLISLDEVSIARPGLPASSEHAREHGQQARQEKDLWAAIGEYPLVVRIKAIDLLAELQDPAFLPISSLR